MSHCHVDGALATQARSSAVVQRYADPARVARRLYKVDQQAVSGAKFLDLLINHFQLKNQSQLGVMCDIPPTMLSKVRHKTKPITDWMLIAMHESLGIEIAELKSLMQLCSDTDYVVQSYRNCRATGNP